MSKYKRIINGDCHFTMTELFDDVEKAANVSNNGELVECKINNLREGETPPSFFLKV